jgi:hypothetical protein
MERDRGARPLLSTAAGTPWASMARNVADGLGWAPLDGLLAEPRLGRPRMIAD